MINASNYAEDSPIQSEDLMDFLEGVKDIVEGFTEKVSASITQLVEVNISADKILEDSGSISLKSEGDLIGTILKDQKDSAAAIRSIAKKLDISLDDATSVYQDNKEIRQTEQAVENALNKKDVISGPEEDGIQELRNRIKGIRERLDETKQRFGVEPELEKDSECDIQFLRDRMQSVQDRIDDTRESIGEHYESMEDTMEDIKENQDDDLERKRQDAWKENLEDQKEEKESRSLKEIFTDMKERLGNIKDSVKKSSGGIFDMLIILGQIAFLVWYYWKDLAPIFANIGKQIATSIRQSLPEWLGGGHKGTDYLNDEGNIIDPEKLQRALEEGDITLEKVRKAQANIKDRNRAASLADNEENPEVKKMFKEFAGEDNPLGKGLSSEQHKILADADENKYERFKTRVEELRPELQKGFYEDLKEKDPLLAESRSKLKATMAAEKQALREIYLQRGRKESDVDTSSSANEYGESPLMKRLVDGIQQQEGWYPGSRSYRNNNPGNLEYGDFAKRHGATGTDGRFAIFPDYETGRAATAALAKSSGYRGMSIAEMGAKWSPGQKEWEKGVSEYSGIDIDQPLNFDEIKDSDQASADLGANKVAQGLEQQAAAQQSGAGEVNIVKGGDSYTAVNNTPSSKVVHSPKDPDNPNTKYFGLVA